MSTCLALEVIICTDSKNIFYYNKNVTTWKTRVIVYLPYVNRMS